MSLLSQPLRFGWSAGAEGAFGGWALALGRAETEGLTWETCVVPQDELDQRALEGSLDVTSMSPAVWALMSDRYVLLADGGRMRASGGPWLVTRRPIIPDALADAALAVGGEHASATLSLQCRLPESRCEIFPACEIPFRIAGGEVDGGVLPAEALARPEARALHRTLDLSAWWSQTNGGRPLPLTVMAARRELGADRLGRVARLLGRSVRLVREHRDAALAHAASFAPGLSPADLAALIDGTLGPWSESAEAGREALETFLDRAADQGWIPSSVKPALE